MDRFIDSKFSKKKGNKTSLKSNMDRFIEFLQTEYQNYTKGLKSNMDRFIVAQKNSRFFAFASFKIQYG